MQSSSRPSSSRISEKLVSPTRASDVRSSEMDEPSLISRPSYAEMATLEFYKKDNWFDLMMERFFKIKTRHTTIKAEIYFGFIHFISCLYCLAVIPQQLKAAGYGSKSTVVAVAACAGVGSIICGFFSNLPFVIAPPTVVSIFLSVFLQMHNDGPSVGNLAVILSGVILILFGWRPLFTLAAELIPVPIQVGTAVGIGLMTALAGSTEINLVVRGTYTILDIGKITPEVMISVAGILIICITMVFHIKGSFCIAVVFCSLVWWIYDDAWPSAVFAEPFADRTTTSGIKNDRLSLLTVDLVFLYVLYLNGLVTSLSNLALLTRVNGKTPRGRWIFIISGIMTIIGGIISAPPMLISPESSASIKAGAKTGLSTVVCGILFCLAVFLSPVFEAVPAAGTSPILIMIGVILFQNVTRIDWKNIVEAAPCFVVLFYIPFTYSVIQGVVIGYIVYAIIALFSGDLRENAINLAIMYFPSKTAWLESLRAKHPDDDDEDHEHEHDPRDSVQISEAQSSIIKASRSQSSDQKGLNLSMMFDAGLVGDVEARRQMSSDRGGMFDTTSNPMSKSEKARREKTGGSMQSAQDLESALVSKDESKASKVPFKSKENRGSSSSSIRSSGGTTGPNHSTSGPNHSISSSGP